MKKYKLIEGETKKERKRRLQKDWYNRNSLKVKEYNKKYSKEYRLLHKDVIKNKNKEYRLKNKDLINISGKEKRLKLKIEVFNHYSNNNIKCKNCNFLDIRALQLDHINGGGNLERKRIFGDVRLAGPIFYKWIKKNNYPEGYQILCANCNIIKGNN